jgi:hypothetical protein
LLPSTSAPAAATSFSSSSSSSEAAAAVNAELLPPAAVNPWNAALSRLSLAQSNLWPSYNRAAMDSARQLLPLHGCYGMQASHTASTTLTAHPLLQAHTLQLAAAAAVMASSQMAADMLLASSTHQLVSSPCAAASAAKMAAQAQAQAQEDQPSSTTQEPVRAAKASTNPHSIEEILQRRCKAETTAASAFTKWKLEMEEKKEALDDDSRDNNGDDEEEIADIAIDN